MIDYRCRKIIHVGIALALTSGVIGLDAVNPPAEKEQSKIFTVASGLECDSKKPIANLKSDAMKVQYLEIVSPDADALVRQYAKIYETEFSEPIAEFGNARTGKLGDGGRIGIRKPLRESETPVVRPYLLVEDIKAAVATAVEAGGKVAMPPMEIKGQGMFAIVIHGGIECGFWQN